MTVIELVAALGGEVVRGRARYWTPDRQCVVIAIAEDDDFVLTEAGERLLAERVPVVPSTPTKRAPGRPAKTPAPAPSVADLVRGLAAAAE